MRVAVASYLVAAAAIVAGCGTSTRTTLTILAVNPSVGRAEFHLTCAPAGGDVPRPARACAALAAEPSLVTRPKPFVCRGGTFSWWDLTLTGRLRGRRIRSHVDTCWTPQMRLVGKLGIARVLQGHLVPRRRRELVAGERRTFGPGVLRPGDLVVCATHVVRLHAGVPLIGDSGESYGGTVPIVALTLTRHRDGSVTAACTRSAQRVTRTSRNSSWWPLTTRSRISPTPAT
jgi:hypothetical protein